jgi:uncharacterized protein (TIGR02265 family)
LLVHLVKAIRADSDGVFDVHLTDEDRTVVAQRILPISWYPFATYKSLFNAMVAVVARNNMKAVRQWGRDYGSTILDDVYQSVIARNNPLRSLKNHEQRFRSFYDFGVLEVSTITQTSATVTIRDFDPDWEAVYQMIAGWIERTVELAGGRNPSVEIISRSWTGDEATVYRVCW